MKPDLYILDSHLARKIYNLCLKESLSKNEISMKLYGKWVPNAVLPTLENLMKFGYIEFVEKGRNFQKKRGKYGSTMLPVLEAMKTLTEPSIDERAFLESASLRKEFFRIHPQLRLEDDWVQPLRTLIDDLLIFRLTVARKADKSFTKLLKVTLKCNKLHNLALSYAKVQKDTKSCIKMQNVAESCIKMQEGAVNRRELHKDVEGSALLQLTSCYDRIIQETIGKYGEQYAVTSKRIKYQGKPMKSLLRTDHLCLSLLMPEALCWRVKFSSPRREIFGLLENLQK